MSVEASITSTRAASSSSTAASSGSSGVPKSTSSTIANTNKQILINSPVKPNSHNQHHIQNSVSHNDFKLNNSNMPSINLDDFKAVYIFDYY